VLFEAGSVFEATGAGRSSRSAFVMGATTPALQKGQGWGTQDGGFFDLKGDVENYCMPFQHRSLTYDGQTATTTTRDTRREHSWMALWWLQFGQLHPEIAATRKLRQSVFRCGDLSRSSISQELRVVRYQPLPRLSGVERDFSFVFDDGVTVREIQHSVTGLGFLSCAAWFRWRFSAGGKVPAGKYSLLLAGPSSVGRPHAAGNEAAACRRQSSRPGGLGGSCASRPIRKSREVTVGKNYPVSSCESEFQA